MKFQIIVATGNLNKVHELREILADPDIRICTMKEAGVAADPDENGSTFEENALIKARAVWENVCRLRRQSRCNPAAAGTTAPSCGPFPPSGSGTSLDWQLPVIVMSDDSGLVIDALGGAPGIHSARFMGHDTSYTRKMNALLEQLRDVPDEKRTARFVCAAAAIFPEGLDPSSEQEQVLTAEGTMEGRIAHSITGENGFGYDPFFYLPALHKTSAQLTDDEKNAISHRGRAVRKLVDYLRNR